MPNHLFHGLLLKSAGFTITMLLIWIGLNAFISGNIWDGMVISKSALTVEYCEFNNVNRLFHQSMNTYSNLAYFFFGILIIQIALEDHKIRHREGLNRMQQFPALSALMGICFIYLCFGSAFFHASLTYIGQRVDMNGTYAVSITLLSIGVYHILHKIDFSPKLRFIWISALGLLIIAFLKIALMVSSSVLLPAMILLLTLMNLVNYIQFRKERFISIAVLSFVLIIIAIKIRTRDVQKINCDPHSFYQGHALWHFLTALSSFCSYAFFRFSRSKHS
jgi:hypothetical protein